MDHIYAVYNTEYDCCNEKKLTLFSLHFIHHFPLATRNCQLTSMSVRPEQKASGWR